MGSSLQDIEFLNLNDVSEDESAFIQALLTTSDCENEFPWEQNATRISKIATKPLLANTGAENQVPAYDVQFPWDEPASKTKGSNGNKTISLNTDTASRGDNGINFTSPAPTPVPVSSPVSTLHTSSTTPTVHYAPPLPPNSTGHTGHVYYIPQPFPYGGPSLLSPLTPNVYVNNMTANVNVHHGLHHVPYAAPPRHYAPEKNDKAASVGPKRTNPPGSPTKRGPPPGTRREDHPAYPGASPAVVSVPAGYNIPVSSVYGGAAASMSFQGTPGTASYVTGQHFYQHTAQTATGAPFMVQQPYFYMAPVYPPPQLHPHTVSGYPETIPSFDHVAAATASPVCATSPGTAAVPVPVYVSPDQRIEVTFQQTVVEENLEQVNSVTGDDFSPSKYILPPTAATEPPVTEDLVKERTEVEPEQQNIEVPPAGKGPEAAAPKADAAPKSGPEEEATQAASLPPSSGGAGRSWASLFKSGAAAASAAPSGLSGPSATAEKPLARVEPFIPYPGPASTSEVVKPAGSGEDEAFARQLGARLAENGLNHTHISLLPRGLTNKSNWCYINATLQALLACPAFVNLMRALNPILALRTTQSSTPIVDSMVDFVGQFDVLTPSLAMSGKLSKKERAGNVSKKEEVPCGPHLEPGAVHRMLSCIRSETFKVEGRQEDAEEFLSCLLNGLHDEMAEVIKLAQKEVKIGTAGAVGGVAPVAQSSASQDDDEWKLIGPKNKGMVTRSATFSRTPISDLFLGQMRSAVTHSGGTPTATLQPFFSLQLDIQNERVTSVQQALEALVAREALQGFTCSRTGTEVEATRQTTLEELPPVLLLHLKCFVYDQTAQAQGGAGIQKLIKRIDFSVDLELSKDFLSPSVRAKVKDRHRQYKLFAVVYHDGKEATKGHYVTDVHHQGLGAWLRYDDSSVKPLCDANLHKYNPPRMPYLLFYRRHDPAK